MGGPTGPVTTGLNLATPKAESDGRKYFFSHRVVNHWNSLTLEVKNASSVNDFKNKLDKHMNNGHF